MESKHWKNGPSEEQLALFEIAPVIALSALRRFVCPDNPPAFLHPRLFNPNKPIVDTHDDTFDYPRGEVIDFPETPPFKDLVA